MANVGRRAQRRVDIDKGPSRADKLASGCVAVLGLLFVVTGGLLVVGYELAGGDDAGLLWKVTSFVVVIGLCLIFLGNIARR